ncbi:MAG: division plane positioning ATPase MipZ [Nitratireductor sp.]
MSSFAATKRWLWQDDNRHASAVALLNAGHKVASIDLDSRQKSLTRYIENRKANNRRRGINLAVPDHFVLDRAVADPAAENETTELGQFQDILQQVERTHDFILIDTPGHDSYSMRLAHSMADTLVTPINDSYVDFDVLGQVELATGKSSISPITPRWCAKPVVTAEPSTMA